MTEKTLRALLNKKRLTSKQRQQLLREANRRLNSAINCFCTVQEACDEAAECINGAGKDYDLTAKDEANMDRLEDSRDALEALVEYLDNADVPDLSEVR